MELIKKEKNKIKPRPFKEYYDDSFQNCLMKPIRSYEWFDPENRNNALEAVKASVRAGHAGFPSQSDLYRNDAISHYNKDKAEKTVFIADQSDIPAKLFTVHNVDDEFRPFAVKSSKWDWKVYPVEMSKEKVPPLFLERSVFFATQGIEFDDYGIAVPLKPNCMPLLHVLKSEIIFTAHRIFVLSKKIAQKTAQKTKPVVKISKEALRNFMKDPVFLGCFGTNPMYLVEIGRWV